MRYILTLFLIALVSSSEIISKADEIKEFAEYDDVQLEFLLGLIPIIGKVVTAAVGLFTKAKAFIVGTKVFKFVKGAIGVGSKIIKGAKGFIAKGKALLEKSKIFKTGKELFDKGQSIYNKYKGVIQDSKLYKRVIGTIDKVKKSQMYQTYEKIKNTYDKGKEIYDQVKGYYEEGKDIYDRYFKKEKTPEEQRQEYIRQTQIRTQPYQTQPQTNKPVTVQDMEKKQALKKYEELKSNNIMTLSTKKTEISNHLNYMLSRGFITPVEKQQMFI